jgi:hypothetical protein
VTLVTQSNFVYRREIAMASRMSLVLLAAAAGTVAVAAWSWPGLSESATAL